MINFLKNIFELWFPQSCVVCNTQVMQYAKYPLCSHCEQKLYPIIEPSCKKCGRPLISEQDLCMECRRKCYEFTGLVPIFQYRTQIHSVLIAYKGNGIQTLVYYFAKCIYDRLCVLAWNVYPLVPVPPRKGKIKYHGWDQVALLANVLEKNYRILILRILYRNKPGVEQKKLDRMNRTTLIHGQFSIITTKKSLPGTIVLFDDVVTTGATINECARVLKKHGCSTIYALAVAID